MMLRWEDRGREYIPVLLLHEVDGFKAAIEVLALFIPAIPLVVDLSSVSPAENGTEDEQWWCSDAERRKERKMTHLDISPAIAQCYYPALLIHVGECVVDMRKVLKRNLLRWKLSSIDPPGLSAIHIKHAK
jgi:hypothetical protein